MVARICNSERPALPFLPGGELLPLLHGEVGKSARWRAQLCRGISLPHGRLDRHILGQAGRTQEQIFQMTKSLAKARDLLSGTLLSEKS